MCPRALEVVSLWQQATVFFDEMPQPNPQSFNIEILIKADQSIQFVSPVIAVRKLDYSCFRVGSNM